jgi:thiol:disulfide interchange protein DsbA
MLFRLMSVVAGLAFTFAVRAQTGPVEGTDYIVLNPPQATETPGKIEVIEFFWYRCPHCYALEPDLESWVKRLPKDVQFRRIPGILNDEWAIDARIFYTLEALGEVDRLHRALFDAIHQEGGVRLSGNGYAKWVADWLAKHKVDMAKYDAAFHSFTVETKLRRAMQLARSYRLDGVPTLVVQGKYSVIASGTMLANTTFLIDQVRKQLARSKR